MLWPEAYTPPPRGWGRSRHIGWSMHECEEEEGHERMRSNS